MFAPAAILMTLSSAIPITESLPAHRGKKFPRILNAPSAVSEKTHLKSSNQKAVPPSETGGGIFTSSVAGNGVTDIPNITVFHRSWVGHGYIRAAEPTANLSY